MRSFHLSTTVAPAVAPAGVQPARTTSAANASGASQSYGLPFDYDPRNSSHVSSQAWVVSASDSTSIRSSLPWKRPAIAYGFGLFSRSLTAEAMAGRFHGNDERKYGASVNPTIRRGSRRAPG